MLYALRNRTTAVVLLAFAAGPVLASDELVFTSAPREASIDAAREVYQPVADFLAKTTGKKFVYRFPGNWLTYQSEMRKGSYDVVFDGPAFIGWRMAAQQHVPLVKVPGNLGFVVAVKNDNTRVQTLKDLAGYTVCGFAPPNLATITMQVEFDNPARQPMLREIDTFKQAYQGMVAGKCVGAVLQGKLFEEYNKDSQAARVIWKSKPVPNQAFTAGPRIDAVTRQKIAEALLTPAGQAATAKMREQFKGQNFVVASAEEYQGLGTLLRDVYGFDLPAAPAQTPNAPAPTKAAKR